jgi:hypothetical protein
MGEGVIRRRLIKGVQERIIEDLPSPHAARSTIPITYTQKSVTYSPLSLGLEYVDSIRSLHGVKEIQRPRNMVNKKTLDGIGPVML